MEIERDQRRRSPRARISLPVVLFWVIISRENRSAADVLLRTSVVYDWASS